jgi:subtilisin family serine protease
VTLIPAWADAFVEGRLPPAPTPALGGPITPAWAYGDASGRGVKVAIVDSGVDADHPLVRGVAGGAVVDTDDEDPDGIRLDEIEHGDLYGHGTACAGIIRGLAPEVEIYSVRVLGAQLTGKAFVFARGLEWCIDNGMHVVNLSLSTSNEDWYAGFQDLCDQAAFAGMVLVAAPANVRRASYPAEFSSVMSVAATVGEDREVFLRNPKPPAEWGAPGVDVEVAWAEGGTIVSTGNSFAAPVMAGHAARVLGAHPGLSPWQVRTILGALAANAVAAR